MTNISKVSDITAADVWEYLREPDEMDTDSEATLNNLIGISKTFIKKYTGQEDLDKFQDFVIVVFVLCQDMWDNKSLYVDEKNLNFVIESILGLHSVNLL